jgi:predicted GH43/DUF377 family glycosyl hydrolase
MKRPHVDFPLDPFTPDAHVILRPRGEGWNTEVMTQMTHPWLEPSAFEDRNGPVWNVTFVEDLVHFHGTWFAYYGQSGSTLGVATYKVGETYGDL